MFTVQRFYVKTENCIVKPNNARFATKNPIPKLRGNFNFHAKCSFFNQVHFGVSPALCVIIQQLFSFLKKKIVKIQSQFHNFKKKSGILAKNPFLGNLPFLADRKLCRNFPRKSLDNFLYIIYQKVKEKTQEYTTLSTASFSS